jgi:hypothetical protein
MPLSEGRRRGYQVGTGTSVRRLRSPSLRSSAERAFRLATPDRNEVSVGQSSSRLGPATKPSRHREVEEKLPDAVCGSVSDVAHVGCERRVDHLHRLQAGIRDAVEEALAGAEQDGNEVEDELVDHPAASA